MAFGFAGAAAGGAKSLEDIVAQRMLAQKLEAEIANRQKQTELDQASLNQRAVEHSDNMKARGRDDDRIDADKRDQNNSRGVRKMIGESLMQGGDPDRRALAAMQIEAGDAPTMLNEPPKRLRQVTTMGPNGRPLNRMAGEDEAVEEYREPPKPSQGPQPDYEWVTGKDGQPRQIRKGTAQMGDRPYEKPTQGTVSNSINPDRAREMLQKLQAAATSLRDSPGRASLSGARIGNPDYALGVSQEPLSGSPAATAKAYFDSVKGLLTAENLDLMKGVLSDTDIKVISSIGTSLNTSMDDPTFAAEVDKIITKATEKLGGGGGMQPINPVSSRGGGAAPAAPSRRFTITRVGG